VESSCKLGNEPSGSIKCWESTEWLHNLWPLGWYSVPRVSSLQTSGKTYFIHDDINRPRVGLATGYRLEVSVVECRDLAGSRNFSTTSTPAPGPIQPSIRSVSEAPGQG
jgi:hypothetical protein